MRLEATAAMQHHRISQSELTSGKPEASRIFSEAAADEQRTALAIAARLNTTIAPGATGMALSLRDGLRILEEALNFYVDVAERSRNEAVVTEAQALAEMAVRRLSLARGGLTQAEIGAWELASGCLRWPAATLLNLSILAIGLVIAPVRVARAWARGRQTSNLYGENGVEHLLPRSVAAMRANLALDQPTRVRARDVLGMLAVALPALALLTTILAAPFGDPVLPCRSR